MIVRFLECKNRYTVPDIALKGRYDRELSFLYLHIYSIQIDLFRKYSFLDKVLNHLLYVPFRSVTHSKKPNSTVRAKYIYNPFPLKIALTKIVTSLLKNSVNPILAALINIIMSSTTQNSAFTVVKYS